MNVLSSECRSQASLDYAESHETTNIIEQYEKVNNQYGSISSAFNATVHICP
jgi:hypothetical protein